MKDLRLNLWINENEVHMKVISMPDEWVEKEILFIKEGLILKSGKISLLQENIVSISNTGLPVIKFKKKVEAENYMISVVDLLVCFAEYSGRNISHIGGKEVGVYDINIETSKEENVILKMKLWRENCKVYMKILEQNEFLRRRFLFRSKDSRLELCSNNYPQLGELTVWIRGVEYFKDFIVASKKNFASEGDAILYIEEIYNLLGAFSRERGYSYDRDDMNIIRSMKTGSGKSCEKCLHYKPFKHENGGIDPCRMYDCDFTNKRHYVEEQKIVTCVCGCPTIFKINLCADCYTQEKR